MTTQQEPPVSVKAALHCPEGWVLLKNDRNEWELPGGRVDETDLTLEDVVRRECREELGVEVQVGPLVHAYLFEVVPGRRVTIVCFLAQTSESSGLSISDEHDEVAVFAPEQLADLSLPTGYRDSIEQAAQLLG